MAQTMPQVRIEIDALLVGIETLLASLPTSTEKTNILAAITTIRTNIA